MTNYMKPVMQTRMQHLSLPICYPCADFHSLLATVVTVIGRYVKPSMNWQVHALNNARFKKSKLFRTKDFMPIWLGGEGQDRQIQGSGHRDSHCRAVHFHRIRIENQGSKEIG